MLFLPTICVAPGAVPRLPVRKFLLLELDLASACSIFPSLSCVADPDSPSVFSFLGWVYSPHSWLPCLFLSIGRFEVVARVTLIGFGWRCLAFLPRCRYPSVFWGVFCETLLRCVAFRNSHSLRAPWFRPSNVRSAVLASNWPPSSLRAILFVDCSDACCSITFRRLMFTAQL